MPLEAWIFNLSKRPRFAMLINQNSKLEVSILGINNDNFHVSPQSKTAWGYGELYQTKVEYHITSI